MQPYRCLTCDSASTALCLFFSFSERVCFHLQTVTSEGHFTGLKFRLSPILRLPRSGAQPRRTSMDSLFLRVPKASERGGDSRLGTLPPWRVYLRFMPSHCCFLIKLMISLVATDEPLDVNGKNESRRSKLLCHFPGDLQKYDNPQISNNFTHQHILVLVATCRTSIGSELLWPAAFRCAFTLYIQL